MTEMELGTAKIVYEDPDEGTSEMTVDNEYVAYFQDHWIVRVGGSEGSAEGHGDTESQVETTQAGEGHDVVRRIPATRVYYVERSVEEFEQEVNTVKDQVQSFTKDIRQRLLGGGETESKDRTEQESYEIEVEPDRSESENP